MIGSRASNLRPAHWLIAAACLLGASSARAQQVDIQQPLARGVAYLQGATDEQWGSGVSSLSAYALLKAGQPENAPFVATAVAGVRSRIRNGRFDVAGLIGNYVAAVDLMFLEAAGAEQYKNEIDACVQYLIANQTAGGYWEYPNNNDRGGDTSQLQYCLLGLWAADRAGHEIPAEVWDKAAGWLLRSQKGDGGFAYTPLRPADQGPPPEDLVSNFSMTVAGIGSLGVIRHILYPGDQLVTKPDEPAAEPTRKFGILQRLDVSGEAAEAEQRSSSAYDVQVTRSQLDEGIRRGLRWLEQNYTISPAGERQAPYARQMYYMYGLERACAFLDLESIGGHDWFAEGVALLKQIQLADGRWTARHEGDTAATSWGLLFLTRATSKLLGRRPRAETFGTGLLKGGRGLPSDLSQALLDDGKVQARKIDDPIEKLLAQLEKQDAPQVEAVQQALVEQVQLGNRNELIGQKDRLVVLASHPHAEVRRTALWALGRSDDFRLVGLMVRSLQDPDVSVRVEAHNALCALSRKPNGFEGLANDPLEGIPEDAAEPDKQAAIERWTTAAYDKWRGWYLLVRPYDERDDLLEPAPSRSR